MLRRRLAVLVLALAGLVLGVTGCTLPTTDNGSGYGPSGNGGRSAIKQPDQPAPVVLKSGVPTTMKVSNSSWAPGNYLVAPDATIALKVVNGDDMQHNFTLEGGSLTKNLPSGAEQLVRFSAPDPGRHRFYCKYHSQEMQGWITVK
jgi:Cupredoxin-like domain